MRNARFSVIYLTVFIDLLGFGLLLPVLPFYAERIGAHGFAVGALVSAFSAAQFVGAFLMGRFSDRVGRKPVLLVSLAGTAVTLVVLGFARSLAVLFIARSLNGLFAGSISTAHAYIADLTAPQERAKYMGMLGASIGAGFVFGPAMGAWLVGFGFGAAAYVAATLAAVNFVLAVFLLNESRPADKMHTAHSRVNFENFTDAINRPNIKSILSSMFLHTLAFTALQATFPLLGESRFGLDAKGMGYIFTFVGVIIILVQGGLVGRLIKRFPEGSIAAAGAVIMGASLAAMPYVPSLALIVLLMGGLSLGNGLILPTLASLLSRNTDADEQGGTLGLGQSLQAAARAVGPLGAGALYDLNHAAPYVIGGAILAVVALVALRLRLRTGALEPQVS